MQNRTEHDSLGIMEVPADSYYGPQTARAIVNFPISGLKPHPALVWATITIKRSAAIANMATGRLSPEIGGAIVTAADEALSGKLADQFVVDPFQAGAGTSHNMNVNEVLANRAAELMGTTRGNYDVVHPNDHVNMAQSTNDVFPTAMRLASLRLLDGLEPALASLSEGLRNRAREFDHILKSGRTHLQDAVPIRMGQEFAAYALAIEKNLSSLVACRTALCELGLGGTAVGTGINAEPAYIEAVVADLARATGFPLRQAEDLIETTQNMDPFVILSGALKATAINLIRISNDLRLLSSGPRTGLAEIVLPAVQPGSSIMPGKVNPSMAEMTSMVCFQVVGSDTVVTMAAQAGQLELNVMMPVIAHNIQFSIQILTNAVTKFTSSCVAGITVNESRCRRYLEESLGLVTVLAPYLGYEKAAEVAKESATTGKSISDIVLDHQLLSREQLEIILDPFPLTHPGVPGRHR
jgi:aspartate ammonia-lyase